MNNTPEQTPDLVSIVDEEGNTHLFEELDRIEYEGQKFIALLPIPENEEDDEEDDELIILSVREDGGEIWLEPIEDDELFDEVAQAFEERLAEQFDFE